MNDDRLLAAIADHDRVLLTGAMGVGKSTSAAAFAAALERAGHSAACIGCDPGSPAFGIPGAVNLGVWRDGAWVLVDHEPLCSLDAARFRLPLIQAVTRLLDRNACARVLIDAPGVVRGVAGAELLVGLVAATNVGVVVVLERDGGVGDLDAELAMLSVPVLRVPASRDARAPSRQARAQRRTALWDGYLRDAEEQRIDLATLHCLGTPPPAGAGAAWPGRQVAFLRGQLGVAFGEITGIEGSTLRARLLGSPAGADALLVRDAQRGADGLLSTAKPLAADVVHVAAESCPAVRAGGTGRLPGVKVGPFVATLVNGEFGDPLLLVRERHGRRCLFFDLGEAGRLRTRTAHEVTDVFISHAHIDHIAGFLWLIRSRIGDFPPCRVYGPPGLAQNIAGFVAGVHWDRVGERRPRFEVAELHGERVLRFAVAAGCGAPQGLGEEVAPEGTLLTDSLFQVRAAVLDHRTPVLAYALEPRAEVKVRKERLAASGLQPGPWLSELKRAAVEGRDSPIRLPDGSTRSALSLAVDLVMVLPGERLVYATDLADTAANRERLCSLARGAHTLFCEASFREADAARAALTGHLTTRACAEIGTTAGVQRLVPFHFSRRYESDPATVYRELRAVCPRTVVPRWVAERPP
jgi:ribonuclease Z